MSITLRNISYSYNRGTSAQTDAIENISFEIRKGKFTGIVGDSGAGKSTLIRLLNGLLKPDSGTITIDGMNAAIPEVKKIVGVLFQNPEKQLFCTTGYEDIAFGPSNMELDENEIHQRVVEAGELVGIDQNQLNKSPFKLSGGEQRRLAMAGVLATRPEYLILDEPTSGMDAEGRQTFLKYLQAVHSRGTTVVMVSHQISEILSVAEEVILIRKGKVGFTGSTEDFITRSRSHVPPITSLMRNIKQRGFDVDNAVFTVDDALSQILKCRDNRKGDKR